MVNAHVAIILHRSAKAVCDLNGSFTVIVRPRKTIRSVVLEMLSGFLSNMIEKL